MDKQLIGVIIGGTIGLLGATLAQIVSHYLALKREKEKRLYEEAKMEKEKAENKSKEFKSYIMGDNNCQINVKIPKTDKLAKTNVIVAIVVLIFSIIGIVWCICR